jgi:hypothetical protein
MDTNLGFNTNALFGSDTVILGNRQQQNSVITLSSQSVAGVASKDWFLGVLGLNTRPSQFSTNGPLLPSLLETLKNQSLIPSLSYSYTAGASYRTWSFLSCCTVDFETDICEAERNAMGSLILGGFDQTRGEPSTADSISFATNDYIAPVVGVSSISGVNTLHGVTSFTQASETFLASVDSSIPHLWLPRSICNAFEEGFGLSYDNTTNSYLIEDAVHAQLKSLNPTITFKIGNGTANGKTTEIVLPYAAFDLSMTWPTYNKSTNYFPLKRAVNVSQYTLGRVLLQEAYINVDFERQNFTLMQAQFPDAHQPSQIKAILSIEDSHGHSRVGKGAIVGTAIGVVAVVLVIVLVTTLGLRRRQRLRRAPSKTGLEDPSADKISKVHSAFPYKELPVDNERQELEISPSELPLGTERQEMEAPVVPQELEAKFLPHQLR